LLNKLRDNGKIAAIKEVLPLYAKIAELCQKDAENHMKKGNYGLAADQFFNQGEALLRKARYDYDLKRVEGTRNPALYQFAVDNH
jgi:hypothetical protein